MSVGIGHFFFAQSWSLVYCEWIQHHLVLWWVAFADVQRIMCERFLWLSIGVPSKAKAIARRCAFYLSRCCSVYFISGVRLQVAS